MSTQSPLAGDPESAKDSELFTDEEPFNAEDGVLYDEDVTPEHGIVGFTLRELLIVGVWLVIFVTSFFPVGWSPTLWSAGIAWILPLGVPTAAVFLVVLRRFSPEGIRRVGSLGIDQFASVAFSVAAVWWAQLLWDYFSSAVQTGVYLAVWVPWVQFVGMLALVALTVFAPLIPGLREDFRGRLVTLAHRNANPVRPVITRPRAETATAQQTSPAIDPDVSSEHTTDEIAHLGLGDSVPMTSHASSGELGTQPGFGSEIGVGNTVGADESDYVPAYARTSRGQFDAGDQDGEDLDTTAPREVAVPSEASTATPAEAVSAQAVPAEAVPAEAMPAEATPAVAAQPFWALAPTERDVFDERGEPLFRIGPSAWALVVEDRGGAYVVRHDDGRVGYLHDIADITKG